MCYELCTSAGITCLSVGHRPTLHRFHSVLVCLDGDTGWSTSQKHAAELSEDTSQSGPNWCSAGQRSSSSLSVQSVEHGNTAVGSTKTSYRFDVTFARRFWMLFQVGFGKVVGLDFTSVPPVVVQYV